ncbi:ANTAR domain-containing protein [Saccharopolyspora cebuensis]|uniref:ANTAR domain-containing protein n=1 Tax=Saccharopolyspora cebuensis TaxID=418759 RepID=A0ABV4CRA0_9PSEU
MPENEAFAVLHRASQHGNTKVRDLAHRVVTTGESHDNVRRCDGNGRPGPSPKLSSVQLGQFVAGTGEVVDQSVRVGGQALEGRPAVR